ncbi:MAG: hypothetical protein AAGI54_00790 [Planctomycetota bacterium]
MIRTVTHTRQAGRRVRDNVERMAKLLDELPREPGTVPAITVHQPWAYLLTAGRLFARRGQPVKTVENRTWLTQYRGPLAIHAANNPAAMRRVYREAPDWLAGLLPPAEELIPTLGHVVGLADLYRITHIDDQPCDPNPFAVGPYLWHLRTVAPLPRPVPAKGRQRLWRWTPTRELRRPA